MSSIEPVLAASMAFSLSVMAFSEAMSGKISSFVMRLTSSSAITFSGSAIARNSRLSSRLTGTNLWLCAVSRGTRSTTSGRMLIRARLIGGTFSTRPMQTARSSGLTYCRSLSMSSFTSRAPSFFWRSSSSSIWFGLNSPSSTSASAMRSAYDLILAMVSGTPCGGWK